MTTRKPISWFLTENGRFFTFSAVTAAGIGFTSAKFLPHSFFLYKYKEFVHYYKDGKPVSLPNSLEECYNKCLDILQFTDVHRKMISPFSVFGFDLFHAGSTNSRFGAAVGIPVNFTYKTLDDIKKDGIQVNQKNVDWDSEVGQKLAEALILPEKVKQFAVCREILMTQNNKFMIESAYPFSCIFFCYTFCQVLNKKMNFYAGPLSLRLVLYTLTSLFGAGSYFLLKDMTEVYYEAEVDKKLVDLGPDFVESGVTFYQKILQRNQALRELMGKEGESKYSKYGNENFGIRQPRLALVHRKQFFEEKLKESQRKSEDDTNEE